MNFFQTMKRGVSVSYNKAKEVVKSPETKQSLGSAGNFFKKIGQNAYDNDFGSSFGRGGLSGNQPNVNFQPAQFSPLVQSPQGFEIQSPLKVQPKENKTYYSGVVNKKKEKSKNYSKTININVR